MDVNTQKIFGIGLSKTGTTSLARALTFLGYNTKDFIGISNYIPGDLSCISGKELEAYDAFTDTPIPSYYKELDRHYPGSKFILTIREKEPWLKSCKKQFNKKLESIESKAMIELFEDIYGCFEFDAEKYWSGYKKFRDGVIDYFKDRPDDLLIVDIASGDGWDKLCPFLKRNIPDIPFPKANVTRIGWTDIQDVVNIARQAGSEVRKTYNILHGLPYDNELDRNRPFGKMRFALDYAAYLLHGGKKNAFKTASGRAHKVIVDNLKKLNPNIPVISREDYNIPFSERRMWNHFWLVDPLDGSFSTPQNMFTVNIALIQDRSPIQGVVYDPLGDTVFYAKANKGAFKSVGEGEPKKIERKSDAKKNQVSEDTPKRVNSHLPNISLAICRAAEGRGNSSTDTENIMEWQVAAAHAVLKSAGMNLLNNQTKHEISYNNLDFKQNSFLIR